MRSGSIRNEQLSELIYRYITSGASFAVHCQMARDYCIVHLIVFLQSRSPRIIKMLQLTR